MSLIYMKSYLDKENENNSGEQLLQYIGTDYCRCWLGLYILGSLAFKIFINELFFSETLIWANILMTTHSTFI